MCIILVFSRERSNRDKRNRIGKRANAEISGSSFFLKAIKRALMGYQSISVFGRFKLVKTV